METNRRLLLEHALQRLGRCRPASVLDVGCGEGDLLAACRDAGWPACGLEPSPADLARPRAAGLAVVAGDAVRLPFPAGGADWVVLRHVPHHLRDPRAALREAWRVARSGLLLAEPWYDELDPGQRAALAIDTFFKRLDRRRGVFHADVLGSTELLALLPATPASSETSTLSPRRPYLPKVFELDFAESAENLTLTPAEVREGDEHRSRVADGGVTLAGTLVLTVAK